MLGQPPAEIVVGDIIRALEGSIAPADCVLEAEEECELVDNCAAHIVWEKVKNSVDQVLDSMTLNELKIKANVEQKDN